MGALPQSPATGRRGRQEGGGGGIGCCSGSRGVPADAKEERDAAKKTAKERAAADKAAAKEERE